MKIAIATAICVERDAISAAAAGQAALAASLENVERVDLFAAQIARPLRVPGHVVSDPWALLRHPRFAEADVAIAHWGIHCDLFDAWTMLPAAGPTPVVMFHNMTPVSIADEHLRPQLEASLVQLTHLSSLPLRWWTYSEENRRELRRVGVIEPARFVPFPIVPPRPVRRGERSEAVRLLTIGRISPAKGTDVLIEALALMAHRLQTPYHLELVGNLAFSDRSFVAQLQRRIDALGLRSSVSISSDADEEGLWTRLERTDIVVCPSLHEGFCVPVIEAYLAGARVVAADGGNLRFLVQPPDPVVPAGDAAALADALERTVRDVVEAVPVDRRAADAICRLFSSSAVRGRLAGALRELHGPPSSVDDVWPAELASAGRSPAGPRRRSCRDGLP